MAFQLVLRGDKELWLAHGELPLGGEWIIPIYVDYFYGGVAGQERKFVRVTRAIDVMDAQVVAALKARLKPHMLQSQAGFCLIAESALHEIAQKAPGVTPTYYFSFGAAQGGAQVMERDAVNENQDSPSASTERFLRFVHSQSQIVPWATLKLVWRALVQNSMIWLSEKKEPIDFGFVELVPIPYRANWTQILKAMHPSAPVIICSGNNQAWKDVRLLEAGFYSSLRSGVMLAMGGNNKETIQWRIEALHHESWWKVVDELEGLVRATRGPVGYCKHVASHVHKRITKTVQIFASWAREANKAAATVGEKQLHGGEFLKSYVPKGLVTPKPPPEGAVRVVVNLEDKKLCGPKDEVQMADEASERLLQVPPIQQGPEDLRDAG